MQVSSLDAEVFSSTYRSSCAFYIENTLISYPASSRVDSTFSLAAGVFILNSCCFMA
jgi:hypothetical protein